MTSALAWLASAVPPWVALTTPEGANPMACVGRVALPDGETVDYCLSIQSDRVLWMESLTVREVGSSHLPRCCLERHINGDGSFCLGFGPTAPQTPTDVPTAARWWAILHGYLELQNLAGLTGLWPRENAWPHGPAAATALLYVEAIEETTPRPVVEAIRRGSLRFRVGSDRLAHPNRPCPCGSSLAVCRCHGPVARTILAGRAAVVAAEAIFTRLYAGSPCCGTMRACPLKDNHLTIGQRP